MTEITILNLLDTRPMYGAEMIEEIKRLSGNAVVMSLPTLYSSLHRMATKKLVNSYWREAAIGGRCHVYNITNQGREYLAKNPIKIDYSLLIDNPVIANQTFSTLEEAFSLPLNKNLTVPQLPDDARILTLPEAQPVATPTTTTTPKTTEKITPYIEPTDQIATTNVVKHKQMSINMFGTIGNSDLREFLKLNDIPVGNDFVIINRLRMLAVVFNALLFTLVNFLCSLTHAVRTEHYYLVYIAILVYATINLAIYLIFPRIKAMFQRGKSFRRRSVISLALLAIVGLICFSEQSLNLIWLGFFAMIPIVEFFIMALMRKWRIFTC